MRDHRRRLIGQEDVDFQTLRRSSERDSETGARRGDAGAFAREVQAAMRDQPARGATGRVETLRMIARELEALDRYERRALSRRKFAIRAFDARRLEAANS